MGSALLFKELEIVYVIAQIIYYHSVIEVTIASQKQLSSIERQVL